MKIRNASVYTSYGNFEQLDVLIQEGVIQEVTPKDGLKNVEDDVTVDGTGMYLIPALMGASVAIQYTLALIGFFAGVAAAIGYDRYLRARGGISFTIVRLF